MNNDPEINPALLTCDWCGKEFPADPRAFVEAGFDAVYENEEGEEWKDPEPATLPPGHVANGDRETMKAKMGIDDAQLDQLLETGEVRDLAAIVCLECQDAAERCEED